MDKIIISEIPSGIWNFHPYFSLPIDRSNKTVSEYLEEKNVLWRFGDDKSADLKVYKEENIRNGLLSFRRIKNEYQKRFEDIPYINLNGEAQENSRISYLLADPKKTFSVAPGNKFRRIYFPSEWHDPMLDTWNERMDRICWIGRPLPDRIRAAKRLVELGVDFDIYSRDPWPLSNWKGFAENEIDISQKYKYKIVFENSKKNFYHSEKLFQSLCAGCVTFYCADPNLALSHMVDIHLPFNEKSILERGELAQKVLENLERFMFSDAWEIYSFKVFFDTIINYGLKCIEQI